MAAAGSFRFEDGDVTGDNGQLRVVFDGTTGGIRSIENVHTGQLLADANQPLPWRLKPAATDMRLLSVNPPPSYDFDTIEEADFDFQIDDGGDAVRLRWSTTRDGIDVEAEARWGSGGSLELWPRVIVGDLEPPIDLTYPIITGPKQLTELGQGDFLVFPVHSGWLIRRPMQQIFPLQAMYPEGNFGCSVQFMAYFAAGEGGFYLATHDPHSTWKTYSFSGAEITFRHDNWDLRRGESMDLDYPVVIAPLRRGDWFEASERYRAWAIDNSPWPTEPKRESEQARWLRDEVWVSLWCTPSEPDWSIFYRYYNDVFEAPIHYVPGWEWPAKRPHTVGYEGYFPAQFHPANRETWEGHYVTPYLNDWFVSPAAEDFYEKWEPHVVRPYSQFDFTVFSHPTGRRIEGETPVGDPRIMTDRPFYFCPHSEAQSELRAWRDLGLVRDYGCTGSFYDISSGCPLGMSRCTHPDHDHPPGRGRHMIEQLDVSNRAAKDRVEKETGRYLVQGTEAIIENIVPSVDFYVARAAAGPMGFLEAWVQGPEEAPGTGRELIPLFQSVYHDVGPVHEDGWIRLIEEEGDLFYWIAARIYVQWGGLMSIHYPLDPAERPPGYVGGSETIAWGGERLVFDELPSLDMSKVGFIKELGRARTTFANAYLGYGRMLRPVSFVCGAIDLNWHQVLPLVSTFRNEGTWTVPLVTHAAWADDASNKIGLMFLNLHAEDPTTIVLDVDTLTTWGIERAGCEVVRQTADGRESLCTIDDSNTLSAKLELPPRRVVLVEIGS